MKKLIFIILILLSYRMPAQDIFQYDFQSGTNGWSTYGDVSLSHISQGNLTAGAAQVEVISTSGNVNQARFYSAYNNLPAGYEGKMLLVKIYAKSDQSSTLRIKAELHRNGTYRAVRCDYTLTASYEKYILPVRIKEGDTDLRIHLQFGTAVGIYTFDDISLTYVPYNLADIRQFELPVVQNYTYATQFTPQTLSSTTTNTTISIDTTQVIAPVLATQIGVNANFRSGNSLVNRSGLYTNFGAFRYPAGSGSDMYFWDGNIPSYTNGYSGTNNRFLDAAHYQQFLQAAGGQATVVANYAYARLGETAAGTREARLSQAAAYAGGFVDRLNNQLNTNARYWEIGNECYGPWENGYNVNGSIITGKEYGEDFRVFVDSMKIADPTIKIGAAMSHNRYYWNKDVMKEIENKADYLIFHHYVTNIASAAGAKNAIQAIEDDILELQLFAKEYTSKPFGYYPVNMTEYNSQGYHTTTMANGLFTTQMIATFIKNRVNLASIWVNEWYVNNNETHGILSKGDANQADYTARPSYIPFYYYPKAFGSKMVQAEVSGDPDIVAFASKFDTGETGLIVLNYSDVPKVFSLDFTQQSTYDIIYRYEIYADNIDEGNTKFYVNGQTSTTTGGGPVDLDAVLPYQAAFQNNNVFTAHAYSINFITIGKLPVTEIISQPSTVAVCLNQSASFNVTAKGQNIHYQWQKNAVDLQGETTSTLNISQVTPAEAGDYTCVIFGDFGTETTQVATLEILAETSIINQPADQTAGLGDSVTFSVTAQGSNLTYQWQKDGQDISGANSNTLIINNVQTTDEGQYQVVIQGDCGQVSSQTVHLHLVSDIAELQKAGIQIYPNPSSGKFFISLRELARNDKITIYNMKGESLLNIRLTNNKQGIDIRHFAQGVYMLRLQNDKSIYNIKIVKE